MTIKGLGRPRSSQLELRSSVVFSLTQSESKEIDRLIAKLGLRSRSEVIRFLVQREASR